MVVAAEGRHHANAVDGDALRKVQAGLLAHGLDVLGVTAIEVFARKSFRCGESDRAVEGKFAAEGQRPLEPAGVEPKCGVLDARFGPEASEHRFGVGPTGYQARVDERARLDVLKAGLGQRFDEPDLVGRADGSRFDLETLARPFLVDFGVRWEVGHGRSSGLSATRSRAFCSGPRFCGTTSSGAAPLRPPGEIGKTPSQPT